MDLTNGTSIDHLKDTPLLGGGDNYLLSTSQVHYSFITVNDAANHHSGKKYIHYGNQIILMNYDKVLICNFPGKYFPGTYTPVFWKHFLWYYHLGMGMVTIPH